MVSLGIISLHYIISPLQNQLFSIKFVNRTVLFILQSTYQLSVSVTRPPSPDASYLLSTPNTDYDFSSPNAVSKPINQTFLTDVCRFIYFSIWLSQHILVSEPVALIHQWNELFYQDNILLKWCVLPCHCRKLSDVNSCIRTSAQCDSSDSDVQWSWKGINDSVSYLCNEGQSGWWHVSHTTTIPTHQKVYCVTAISKLAPVSCQKISICVNITTPEIWSWIPRSHSI